MKKYLYVLFMFSASITGCGMQNNTNSSYISSIENQVSSITSSLPNSYKNYTSYENFTIKLNDMFNQNDVTYGVYFYSEYCPACASLKELLFNYMDNNNKCINLYLVDIGTTSEEDFSKLKNTNGLYEEEIINNNIGATTVEEVYFRTSPCIYFINNNNGKNSIFNHYVNYSDVYNFLFNNVMK